MKSILIIVPFTNVYPPKNGGMQRCFNIINQLAKHFDVTLIINQDKNDFLKSKQYFPSISNLNILSTVDVKYKDIFSVLPSKLRNALRYRWIKKTVKGPADGNFLKYYPVLKNLLKEKRFDIIILEQISTINSISIIRRYDKNVKIYFDAYNVESNLIKVAVERKETKPNYYLKTLEIESNFYKSLDGVLCCSKDDSETIQTLNSGLIKTEIVPNGVNVPVFPSNAGIMSDNPKSILFCGSLGYSPNSEGLLWFAKKIWPGVLKEFPNLKLLIIGSGELQTQYKEIELTKNIELIGSVDSLEIWYNKVSASIVPLLTGSGTRLKILEAMGFGVPVISTSVGAEGIIVNNFENIIIADDELDFTKKIIHLLSNKKQRLKISYAARELVKINYDWNIIGDNLARYLNQNRN